jgi:hypothetical protein
MRQKEVMKGCILIAITLCLFGCSEECLNPVDSTVHLAGFVANTTGGSVASYWKDSVYTALANFEISSQVSSLYVDGSSVLIGGSKFVANSPIPALIWRDGAESVIEGSFGNPMIGSRDNNLFGAWFGTTGWVFHKNGTSQPIIDTAYNFAPMAMALLGDDMYISGFSSSPALPPTYSPPQHAQCWKNGQLIFRESEVSNALSIFIHQNDIYMVGHVYDNALPKSIACYWKNGHRVNLTDGNMNAIATSVFVTDTHVYASGMMNDQAVYWKDGDAIALTTTGTYSMANSIIVQEEDVYVGGYQNGHPAYWKNNIRQGIANQDKLGQVLFVVVGSN